MGIDQEKENPDTLAGEIGVQGIEALPGKVNRYGIAKKGAVDIANYINKEHPELHAIAFKVLSCGDYLAFRHYFTVDKVKLHGASLCKKHLLCPLCAIRRGAKALKAYLDRWEVIKSENPRLKAYMVTLTVKDGPDLEERFEHLKKSQHELWKQKHRGRGSPLDRVVGAVWSYEVKRGKNSGEWHPHLHMIALAEDLQLEEARDLGPLSATWKNITGDSHMVNVREVEHENPVNGFLEVFKYAVKFSDQPAADTLHCWVTLATKRLLASSGVFRGVVVPDSLLDDPEGLQDLPYATLFYRFIHGKGYTLRPSYAR